MPWNPDWPIGNKSVKFNESPGQENTTYLETTLKINHYFDESAPNDGKHKFVQMPNGTLPAGLVSGDSTLYSKASGVAQLFYSHGNSALEYQLTTGRLTDNSTFGTNTAYAVNHLGGWTFLPGGLIMQYGLRTVPGGSGQISFPCAFSAVPYQISVSLYRSTDDHNVVVSTAIVPTTTTFNYLCDTSGSTAVSWTAIGKG